MSRVGIAELKAHLSKHLRAVRAGSTVTVLDRDTPVARIVPYDAPPGLEIRKATRDTPWELPPPADSPTDSLALLLEDRAKR
jgi:prevent-host-death family protein